MKSYFTLFACILISAIKGYGQMVANDDVFNDMNGITGSNTIPANNPLRVIQNDLLNGNPVLASQVGLIQLSSTSPNVNLITSVGGYVKVEPGTPAGTYYITYQICAATPDLCDTAVVTVQVCGVPAPVDLTECDTPLGTVLLGGLPETGSWTIWGKMDAGFPTYWDTPYIQLATGTGLTTTLTGLTPSESYRLKVVNESGCSSDHLYVYVGNVANNGATFTGEMSGEYVDLNNDGIVNIGDVVQYHFLFTNASDCDLHDIYYFLNDDPYPSGTLNMIPANSTATAVLNNLITENNINDGFVNQFANYGGYYENGQGDGFKIWSDNVDLAISDGFKVHAFLDVNANNIQDNDEADFTSGYFNITRVDDNQTSQISSSSPSYIFYETNPDHLYNISYYLNENCQYGNTITYSNVSVAAGSGILTYNFPITYTPDLCNDVVTTLYPLGAPRPGFEYKTTIRYKNNGVQAIPSGTITFIPDNAVSITSISQSGTVPSGNGFTHTFSNLLPGEARYFIVTMQVPTIPTVNLGDQLTTTASVSIPLSEVNVANNVSELVQTMVGSYDPNDKTENHGGKIVHSTFSSEDYLTYTIRFENTGTASALSAKVDDTLDMKLDETTVRMVQASHPYVLERNGNLLEWRFNGINLPPSAGDDAGKGFIVFQVKPKPGYAIGDIIPNTAEIYFDFNPAITTNTFETEYTAPLSVDGIEGNTLSWYPNPVKDKLNINSRQNIQTLTVYNLLGQPVLEKRIDAVSGTLDTSDLEGGVYLVRVISAEAEKTIRILKQ
ncbi:hypothetical protein HYN48_02315 [Flavobacterium magnum]|uniref:Uncharacterized protein n=1 Tax=Flavobacterium magnum TaxID=2162713 RepID=A0A2S0RBR2_9FLAO|nr:T9SS type A sorting domain-containing protein [Flavobacterium magnum]AWA29015.1 hypothetical protein HYN48_02315 [Flavobacterium magnum]